MSKQLDASAVDCVIFDHRTLCHMHRQTLTHTLPQTTVVGSFKTLWFVYILLIILLVGLCAAFCMRADGRKAREKNAHGRGRNDERR